MNFFDATREIEKLYPHLNADEIRWAMDMEVKAEEQRLTGRNKYARAIPVVKYRIIAWLREGAEYQVEVDSLDSLAKFVVSYRPATVWAVLRSRQMKQAGECECLNCAVCHGTLTICGRCRMCTRCHKHAAGCPGCHGEPRATT